MSVANFHEGRTAICLRREEKLQRSSCSVRKTRRLKKGRVRFVRLILSSLHSSSYRLFPCFCFFEWRLTLASLNQCNLRVESLSMFGFGDKKQTVPVLVWPREADSIENECCFARAGIFQSRLNLSHVGSAQLACACIAVRAQLVGFVKKCGYIIH